MSLTDRRSETRVDVSVPLTYRAVTKPPSNQQPAESVNISPRGLCFATVNQIKQGTQVEVFMEMPAEITGKAAANVRCVAHVIHTKTEWTSGKTLVGLRVDRYETLAAEQNRWAS